MLLWMFWLALCIQGDLQVKKNVCKSHHSIYKSGDVGSDSEDGWFSEIRTAAVQSST